MEDGKIIDLFWARDEQAISELSAKYGEICKRISGNILKNEQDAEECVNDALLALWNRIPPERPEPLKSFVLRIVRNISIAKYHANTAQKRNSYYDVALEELEECIADPVDEIRSRELSRLLNRFLDGLERESRVMFVCRYWCSESPAAIAEKLGTNAHRVSVRLSRIREKLKKYLQKEGYRL